MTIQNNLFPDEVIRAYRISFSFNQDRIIQNICELHIKGVIELDPTYSKGNFYKAGIVNEPKYKYDLFPQTVDTIQSDFINIPLDADSINSIMFDPPFLIKTDENETGKIKARFSCFENITDLESSYQLALNEFYRLLKPKGYLIFKCQDFCCGGKQYFSHIDYVYTPAKEIGFKAIDLIILLAKNKITKVHWGNQKHVMKLHSYFWVFKK